MIVKDRKKGSIAALLLLGFLMLSLFVGAALVKHRQDLRRGAAGNLRFGIFNPNHINVAPGKEAVVSYYLNEAFTKQRHNRVSGVDLKIPYSCQYAELENLITNAGTTEGTTTNTFDKVILQKVSGCRNGKATIHIVMVRTKGQPQQVGKILQLKFKMKNNPGHQVYIIKKSGSGWNWQIKAVGPQANANGKPSYYAGLVGDDVYWNPTEPTSAPTVHPSPSVVPSPEPSPSTIPHPTITPIITRRPVGTPVPFPSGVGLIRCPDGTYLTWVRPKISSNFEDFKKSNPQPCSHLPCPQISCPATKINVGGKPVEFFVCADREGAWCALPGAGFQITFKVDGVKAKGVTIPVKLHFVDLEYAPEEKKEELYRRDFAMVAKSDEKGVFHVGMKERKEMNMRPGNHYIVSIKGPKHLAVNFCRNGQKKVGCNIGEIVLKPGLNTLDFTGVPLPAGDIPDKNGKQDGVVDARDFARLVESLRANAPSWLKKAADLNYDGINNGADIQLFLKTMSRRYDDSF